MKKMGFDRGLNKILTKYEASSSSEFDQIKSMKTGWAGRLGDAKRALSRKVKGFSFPSTSSSTLLSTAPPPPKRAPSTTLTLRSKSMTAELEELGECQTVGTQTTLFSSFSVIILHLLHHSNLAYLLILQESLVLACSCHFPSSADAIFFPQSFCSEKKRR